MEVKLGPLTQLSAALLLFDQTKNECSQKIFTMNWDSESIKKTPLM